MKLCPAQKFQHIEKPIFHLKTWMLSTFMYYCFCILMLTTFKGHMLFSQRCNTPNNDFVRLCDRIFHTIGTSTPRRHLTLWCALSSSLLVLCFIREAQLCRCEVCCCCLQAADTTENTTHFGWWYGTQHMNTPHSHESSTHHFFCVLYFNIF